MLVKVDLPPHEPDPVLCRLRVDAKYDNGETASLQFESVPADVVPDIIRLIREKRTQTQLEPHND